MFSVRKFKFLVFNAGQISRTEVRPSTDRLSSARRVRSRLNSATACATVSTALPPGLTSGTRRTFFWPLPSSTSRRSGVHRIARYESPTGVPPFRQPKLKNRYATKSRKSFPPAAAWSAFISWKRQFKLLIVQLSRLSCYRPTSRCRTRRPGVENFSRTDQYRSTARDWCGQGKFSNWRGGGSRHPAKDRFHFRSARNSHQPIAGSRRRNSRLCQRAAGLAVSHRHGKTRRARRGGYLQPRHHVCGSRCR